MKKVWVKLFGHQNRRIQIDASATEGAQIGKNLYWPDGTVVTEAELRGLQTALSSYGNEFASLKALVQYLLANGTGGGGTDYPLHKDEITDDLVIPDLFQYLIWGEITVQSRLTVEPGGELIIFDRPLADLNKPDFTYNVGGDLTQIDYGDGSQKVFTYNGSGDLQYVDLTRDGWTLRKEFVYSGDELDYVDEYYV